MSAEPGHLRKHGHIHAIWLISILIAVNAWNLITSPNGDIVTKYISFASSLASLVLAIVAIFYSFVQNRESTENSGRLSSSAERTERAAGAVLSLTSQLQGQLDRLGADFEILKPAVTEMSGNVSEVKALLAGTNANDPARTSSEAGGIAITKLSNGIAISLYLVLRGEEEGKPFDATRIFSNDDLWQAYTAGFLQSIETFKPMNIEISSKSSIFKV
jgi:hypothetical protein